MICKSEVITTDFIHDCAGDAAWVSGRDWLGRGCALARVPGSWGRYWVLHTTQITTLSSHRHTRLRVIWQGSFYVFVCLHICNIPLWPVSLQTDSLAGRRGGCAMIRVGWRLGGGLCSGRQRDCDWARDPGQPGPQGTQEENCLGRLGWHLQTWPGGRLRYPLTLPHSCQIGKCYLQFYDSG